MNICFEFVVNDKCKTYHHRRHNFKFFYNFLDVNNDCFFDKQLNVIEIIYDKTFRDMFYSSYWTNIETIYSLFDDLFFSEWCYDRNFWWFFEIAIVVVNHWNDVFQFYNVCFLNDRNALVSNIETHNRQLIM